MKYLEIKLENNKSVLVDESAEIIPVDTWCQGMDNIFQYKGKINIDNGRLPNIIIASINHSISLDLPMVIVEDEVEKLALDSYNAAYPSYEKVLDYKTIEKFRSVKSYIKGYKAAQQNYSKEDLCNLVQQLKDYTNESLNILGCDEREPQEFVDIFLKSLNKKYIDLEEEIFIEEETGEIYKWVNKRIKTNRVDNQLMAYVKNK